MNLSNQQARHVALYCSGLKSDRHSKCTSSYLESLIQFLGYVQQDPIRVVARAHDHILSSRCSSYRPEQLDKLLEEERRVFEHFSHDACILPMSCLPYWQKQFDRYAARFKNRGLRDNLLTKQDHKNLIERLTLEGPLCSSDFKVATNGKNTKSADKSGVWSKPAHKQTLDHLWFTGELAVSKRVKFKKYYDLAERIYPKELIDSKASDKATMAWLSTHALNRLGFASHSEIKHFWDACELEETKQWCNDNTPLLSDITYESATGEKVSALALTDNVALLQDPPSPSKRMRIINPFDPIMRDRKRLKRLFGFEYRIEMYVPAEKREYGYYVYPLLEYDRFVGRIEVRHDRESNVLCVDNLWPEPGIIFGKQRMEKLNSELERLKHFLLIPRTCPALWGQNIVIP